MQQYQAAVLGVCLEGLQPDQMGCSQTNLEGCTYACLVSTMIMEVCEYIYR